MAEISDAADKLGFPLTGIATTRGELTPEKTVIAFFRDSQEGHFAVIRPMGNTRTLVQLIDPPYASRTIDYKQLIDSNSWTGRLLVPRDPWWSRFQNSTSIGLVAGLIAVAGFLVPWAVRRSPRHPNESRRIAA